MNRMTNPPLAVALLGLLAACVNAQECGRPLLRVSNAADGEQGNHHSDTGYASRLGTYVTFMSVASNLLPGDDNGLHDVFRLNVRTGELELVSVALDGGVGNKRSEFSWMDWDGAVVCFNSQASDLVEDDTNGWRDVFVRDMEAGVTIRVSVSSEGQEGNRTSYSSGINGDGRYVTFASHATNLVPDDTNGTFDVFVHDLWTGETTLESVSSDGEQGNRGASGSAVTPDGQYLVFTTSSSNLAPGDTNNVADVFVRNRWSGVTTRVSMAWDGQEGNGESQGKWISDDGRFVAFESLAGNLVPDDNNFAEDVFVVEWDAFPPKIERVSVSSEGEEGDDDSSRPGISGDGRFVVFRSFTTNLVPEGASGGGDIYVHDRLTHTTRLVSTTATGEWGNNWSITPTISADGGLVVFNSSATNMVPADTNGFDDVFLRAINVDPLTPGDGDCDGDIDFADFAVVQRCFTLHWYDPPVGPECYALDFNFDGDVDRRDFADYLAARSGPR